MGFITSASTTTLTASLTPIGRQRLASTNNSLIATFALGDSDANYNIPLTLSSGQVPTEAGGIGTNASISNSTAANASIKSFLILNSSGSLRKSVESQSINITSNVISNGITTISGTNLTQNIVNRNDSTNSLVNLFYSFGLPLSSTDDNIYTGVTFANGGYSDTALSGLTNTTSKILVIGLNNTTYGESLDGKTIKISLPTSETTYTIYSTFQNNGTSLKIEDANTSETSPTTTYLGPNIALLFSDNISKPNSNSSLSWSTGFGTTKPFSINAKQLYNLQTNSNTSTTADTIVGVAYLDKGFVVITHPQILSAYTVSASTRTSITFDSVSTSISQTITCIAGRGEFGASTNKTFTGVDTPRISELGLFDNLGNLIAVAKTDRHVTKNINEFYAFSVKINL